jgi:hypothetical protein
MRVLVVQAAIESLLCILGLLELTPSLLVLVEAVLIMETAVRFHSLLVLDLQL